MAVVQQAAVLYRMSEFIDLVKKIAPKGLFFITTKSTPAACEFVCDYALSHFGNFLGQT